MTAYAFSVTIRRYMFFYWKWKVIDMTNVGPMSLRKQPRRSMLSGRQIRRTPSVSDGRVIISSERARTSYDTEFDGLRAELIVAMGSSWASSNDIRRVLDIVDESYGRPINEVAALIAKLQQKYNKET